MRKYRYSTIKTIQGEEVGSLLSREWFKDMRREAVTSRVLCFKTGKLLCETDMDGEITYAYVDAEEADNE